MEGGMDRGRERGRDGWMKKGRKSEEEKGEGKD